MPQEEVEHSDVKQADAEQVEAKPAPDSQIVASEDSPATEVEVSSGKKASAELASDEDAPSDSSEVSDDTAAAEETKPAVKEEDKPSDKKENPSKRRSKVRYILINCCRFILAFTFLFSAFVKANDPVGFSIKLKDYALAIGMTDVPQYLLLLACMSMVAIESVLGIYLFVGVRRRKRIAGFSVLFMGAMTFITIWLVISNPVSDCGCFGDAVKLTNWQTFGKNIVLLAMAIVVMLKHKLMFSIIPKNWNWLVTIPVVAAMMVFATYSYYMLPTVDFLPFSEGTDLRKTVRSGNGLDMRFKVTIVYKRGDEILELSDQDDDPDSTWTYVETRNELLEDNLEGQTDWFVLDSDGDDVTDDILMNDGYSFIVTVPDLEDASEAIGGKLNAIFDYSENFGYGFYFITAADDDQRERWTRNTGAQYELYDSDDRILWQMVRDNPGMILLHDGVVKKKWSQFSIPLFDYTKPLDAASMQELIKVRRYSVAPLDFTK